MVRTSPDKTGGSSVRLVWVLALLVLLILGAGFVWTYKTGPVPPAWYPACPLVATTGLLCPGCGSARVLHDIAHGHFLAALGHNILVVLFLPCLALWGADVFWRRVRNKPPREISRRAAFAVLIVIMVFWIARNLPWWPFTLLAP